MALCETATNDPKWGFLSLFPRTRKTKWKFRLFPSASHLAHFTNSRAAISLFPTRRDRLQKLELKIDPFAARAKMHLAVAWFVLHWHYAAVLCLRSTYLLFTLQTPALRSMRDREMLSLYGVRGHQEEVPPRHYELCWKDVRCAGTTWNTFQVRRVVDERQSRCVTNRLHFAGVSDTFFCQPIAARRRRDSYAKTHMHTTIWQFKCITRVCDANLVQLKVIISQWHRLDFLVKGSKHFSHRFLNLLKFDFSVFWRNIIYSHQAISGRLFICNYLRPEIVLLKSMFVMNEWIFKCKTDTKIHYIFAKRSFQRYVSHVIQVGNYILNSQ